MKENEAIEVLKNNYPKTCKMVNGRYQGGFDNKECDFGQALTTAVSALKEIQQYRAIGTVEECREAVEKQKAKKPRLNYKPKFFGRATYTCPRCGNYCLEEFANERQNNRYCWDCGQKIDFGGSYAKDSLKIVEKGGIE